MTDPISYGKLRDLQEKERENKKLQKIEGSFFERVREYLSEKEKAIEENRDKDNVFAEDSVKKTKKEIENARKILEDIFSRRVRKIVNQAITNLTAEVYDTENMLSEEREMYENLVEMVKQKKSEIMSRTEPGSGSHGSTPTKEPKEEESESPNDDLDVDSDTSEGDTSKEEVSPVELKFDQNIPSFMWGGGKTYGPFEEGDSAELPREVANMLLKKEKVSKVKGE